MNKKVLVTMIMAGSIATSTAFASNVFQQLLSGKQPTSHKVVSHKKSSIKKNSEHYTDFSGNWSGNCISSTEGSYPIELDLENDDLYLSVNGLNFTIGSLETQSTADSDSSDYVHSSVQWNDKMSKLIVNAVIINHDNDSLPFNHTNPLFTMLSQFTLSMENNQLILNGKIDSYSGQDQIQKDLTIVCTTNKQ